MPSEFNGTGIHKVKVEVEDAIIQHQISLFPAQSY